MGLGYSLAELLEKLVNSPNDARLYTSVRVGIERLQARVKELERERDHANMVTDAAAEKVKELEGGRSEKVAMQ